MKSEAINDSVIRNNSESHFHAELYSYNFAVTIRCVALFFVIHHKRPALSFLVDKSLDARESVSEFQIQVPNFISPRMYVMIQLNKHSIHLFLYYYKLSNE
jgi:hypothetical protein